jgi:hypothetical protein
MKTEYLFFQKINTALAHIEDTDEVIFDGIRSGECILIAECLLYVEAYVIREKRWSAFFVFDTSFWEDGNNFIQSPIETIRWIRHGIYKRSRPSEALARARQIIDENLNLMCLQGNGFFEHPVFVKINRKVQYSFDLEQI